MILRNFSGMVLAGGLAAALFAVNFIVGASLSWASGLAGLSGLVTGITVGFTFYIASRLTETFGTVTLLWTLYSLFAIPTPLMGPPVPQKVLIGFAAGLVYDVVLQLCRRKPCAYYLAFIAYITTLTALFIKVFVGQHMEPDVAAVSNTLKAVINIVFIGEGLATTWIASRWWTRNIQGTPLESRFRFSEAAKPQSDVPPAQ